MKMQVTKLVQIFLKGGRWAESNREDEFDQSSLCAYMSMSQ
jgi:hypothetical protein